jgi:hypothetical protein
VNVEFQYSDRTTTIDTVVYQNTRYSIVESLPMSAFLLQKEFAWMVDDPDLPFYLTPLVGVLSRVSAKLVIPTKLKTEMNVLVSLKQILPNPEAIRGHQPLSQEEPGEIVISDL